MKRCTVTNQPEFQELSEAARKMYYGCHVQLASAAICRAPAAARQRAGATDDDVRELLHRGYLVPLPGGQAFIVQCPYMREFVEEFFEQNGRSPTLEEIEHCTHGQDWG